MEPLLDAEMAHASPATFDIRDNSQRGQVVQYIFIGLLVVGILALVSGYMQLTLLQTINSGGEWTEEEANTNDLRQGIIGILQMCGTIVGAVFFIRWFRRAYYNLHATGLFTLKHTEGWAAGAWFVPFINLYYPYQIMHEIWRDTQRAYTRETESAGLVGGWWTCWIIGNFISNASFRMSLRSSDTIEGMISSTEMDMASSVFDIIAAFLAFLVIRQVRGYESLFFDYFKQGNTSLEGEHVEQEEASEEHQDAADSPDTQDVKD